MAIDRIRSPDRAVMRVIGGTARGRRLAPLSGRAIRPTPDRVREALFSIIYSRCGGLTGRRVLDLFAGSGALGIEALSRGALHAWFVDSSRDATGTIRDNLERCGLSARATVIMREAREALSAVADAGPFDLVLADPPYGLDHAAGLLEGIEQRALLADDGLICLETAVADPVPIRIGALQQVDQRRYGSTMLHLYQRASEEQA